MVPSEPNVQEKEKESSEWQNFRDCLISFEVHYIVEVFQPIQSWDCFCTLQAAPVWIDSWSRDTGKNSRILHGLDPI